MVTCIYQDRYGFMWFATLDGLNRYDGYHFLVYRHDARFPTSITESFVQTMFEDSKGRLWIGSFSGGVDLFDRKTETFIHFKHRKGDPASLAEGPIHSIFEDEHGNIWVHVANELDKILISKDTLNMSFSIHHIIMPVHSQGSCLYTPQNRNTYYVNNQEGVVYKLDNERLGKWSVTFNLNDYLKTQYIKGTLTNTHHILQLVRDTLLEKIYIFYEEGVICFDERTSKPDKVYNITLLKNQTYMAKPCLDKNGIVCFACQNNIYFFNTVSGQLNYAVTEDSDISRSVKHTYSTFVDRSGLLWIGTSGYGILKRNALAEAFHHTSNLYTYSFKEADDGEITIGNSASARQLFDKANGKFIDTTLNIKANNKHWGLPRSSLPGLADTTNSWFVYNNRLYSTDKDISRSVSYPLPVSPITGYDGSIQCHVKDSSGNIWVGTTEGLLRFNLASKRWTIYKSGFKDSISLSSNMIFSLCLDKVQPKKYLWIGTGGSGLNRMDMTTGKFQAYSTKDGLPNDVIYGILNDDNDNLWISTNKGLTCFNLSKQNFKNFDYKDGLQSNEFNRGAYLKTRDGCLFFGGVNGFNYFYPNEIFNNTTIPLIQITGLAIRNQPVPILSKGSPLTEAIYLTRNLILSYDQNFLSFEFASMDFTNSEQNQYQYKLQGFDRDWVPSANTHSATYTNLDPGKYIFMVKGSNNHGVWNEEGTSIQITILPPWYMTWWFRAALLIVVVWIGYAVYRYRLTQVLKLHTIRNRIAGDLHDEVGSNLSNIYIFSNVALQKLTRNNEMAPLLEKITDYTRQSMDAMTDIVWMINTRNDRFENIMVRMRTIAAEFSEVSGCLLHLRFDEKLNDVKLKMEERKNFYLIYKEAINNAAKYAACKNLWIELELYGATVLLIIKDDGKGFDSLNIHNGNGLFNMKKRADLLKGSLTINSIIGEGTTVQLSFKA